MSSQIATTEGIQSVTVVDESVALQHKKRPQFDLVKETVVDRFLRADPEFGLFLTKKTELARLEVRDLEIASTCDAEDIKGPRHHALKLFISRRLANDIPQLNDCFRAVHDRLCRDGIFAGRAESLENLSQRLWSMYPRPLARICAGTYFLFSRLMPRLPLLRAIYKRLSSGRRPLSKTEVLGRLCYSGFDVVDVHESKGEFFFLARKSRRPSVDKHPSTGLLIKLRRVGKDGKNISINKLRSMHPYSEYLQEYVYQQNNLRRNGKFNDDFRVTKWGHFIRKYWLDELPQFINLLRGDIALVGVRALSEQYFGLYPKELQKLRTRFKPGLIPPYYADLPTCFDEIVESEKRYLNAKLGRPFTTDIRYLLKAMSNIIFRHARST
jgi:lipopolysaccharide/colanic/teichoic acid biosynthesis glycosyltransferase